MENNQLEWGDYLRRVFIEYHCLVAAGVLFYTATTPSMKPILWWREGRGGLIQQKISRKCFFKKKKKKKTLWLLFIDRVQLPQG